MSPVIWCTPGRSDEADLIAEIATRGMTVVRRCIEAADLIAAATIDECAALVIDASAPRLSSDTVTSIAGRKERVIVFLSNDDDAIARAHSWHDGALGAVLDTRLLAGPAAVVESITAIINSAPAQQQDLSADQSMVEPGISTVDRDDDGMRSVREGNRGSIVVVWGPHGAPGRSTVALGLAESWARSGLRTCLVDADTISPSLAHLVGMTEDVSGLLLAARYADQGALDARSLGSACRQLTNSLWLLSGIGSSDRWTQARTSALDRLWPECARHFDRVVVDVGGVLHTQEVDDPFHGIGMQRDAATLSALRASDRVVAVTRPDVVGVVRLINDLPEVYSQTEHSNVDIVVNQVPRRLRSAQSHVRDALQEAGISARVYSLAADDSIRECLDKGALMSEVPSLGKTRRSLNKISIAVAA
jgi:MinD-like ATPase involved in chromosome partitioning or flagellar assembly